MRMNKGTVLGMGVILFGCVAAYAEGPLAFEVTADYMSKYIWRGQDFTDEPVFQPGATVAYKNLTLGVWGNLETTSVNGQSGDFTEVDYYVDYSASLEDDLPLDCRISSIHWGSFTLIYNSKSSEFIIYGRSRCTSDLPFSLSRSINVTDTLFLLLARLICQEYIENMLTKTDLSQIRKITRQETKAIVQQETKTITRKELKPIKTDIAKIRKDIGVIISFFDKEYLELRHRVKRIEEHLNLSPMSI